jgi:hypothetical protein
VPLLVHSAGLAVTLANGDRYALQRQQGAVQTDVGGDLLQNRVSPCLRATYPALVITTSVTHPVATARHLLTSA